MKSLLTLLRTLLLLGLVAVAATVWHERRRLGPSLPPVMTVPHPPTATAPTSQVESLALPAESPAVRPFDPAFVRLSAQEIAALPVAVRFDHPMGSQNAALTYNAQPFRITRHLGDDLNGIGGENSDLGDPVFAAGAGKVVYCGVPGPGWGNVVIIAHRVPESEAPGGFSLYQTMYAHLERILVMPNKIVQRGLQVGTVGTASGRYFAHLHFEVRRGPYVNPGIGYADVPLNRLSPEKFIREHRGAPDDQLNPAPIAAH